MDLSPPPLLTLFLEARGEFDPIAAGLLSGFRVVRIILIESGNVCPVSRLITMILDRINPKLLNVIDSAELERDAGGKPVSTFPHSAQRFQVWTLVPPRANMLFD